MMCLPYTDQFVNTVWVNNFCIVKKVFKNISEGRRSFGKPRKRWLDDVENDLKKLGVRGWRKTAKDRDIWQLVLKDARILQGL
jgi:hypothetical protein